MNCLNNRFPWYSRMWGRWGARLLQCTACLAILEIQTTRSHGDAESDSSERGVLLPKCRIQVSSYNAHTFPKSDCLSTYCDSDSGALLDQMEDILVSC